MEIAARRAHESDVSELVRMYRLLETEQAALKALWPVADGLPEPIESSFAKHLSEDDSLIVIGIIDDIPLGFLWIRSEALLPQAAGALVGVVRLVFVETAARGVGVGEAMIAMVMDDFRSRGITMFDSHVSPGHRLAKNFFESHGYSARSIVMHHSEDTRWH